MFVKNGIYMIYGFAFQFNETNSCEIWFNVRLLYCLHILCENIFMLKCISMAVA